MPSAGRQQDGYPRRDSALHSHCDGEAEDLAGGLQGTLSDVPGSSVLDRVDHPDEMRCRDLSDWLVA